MTAKLISYLFVACLAAAAACTPSSPTAAKIEAGLDQLKAGIDANPSDCKKMAEAIQGPVNDVVAGMREMQEKKESLPATTKLKIARVTASFQGLGPCAKAPEMIALVQTIVASAAVK